MTTFEADREALLQTLENARGLLLEQRNRGGWWLGELSSSALSTATATLALSLLRDSHREGNGKIEEVIQAGHAWLGWHQNSDGGFGDTPDSPSNLSTTALAWTALGPDNEAGAAARDWIRDRVGGLDAHSLAETLRGIYGSDRTFAVPILAACSIGGAFPPDDPGWDVVPGLPFELAVLPRRLFKVLGLPVVSYALPALIAIGRTIEHHRPSPNPLARLVRRAARGRVLTVLERLQPRNGGFLEATPLTSFVLLSLVSTGDATHPVARRALDFILRSVRLDGSWPIDTNLATWVTTLAVNALGEALPPEERAPIRSWLLDQQHREVHRYTGADPGGWAWTDLPGGVPDADDTAGALLALRSLGMMESSAPGAWAGSDWLAGLQNRDGGVPTFCRGWGKLPFDRSSPDLTAHALRAWDAWAEGEWHRRSEAIQRGTRYLCEVQRSDGAWVPLWFGNQEEAHCENPVYGTSRVLRAVTCARDAAWEGWRRALMRGLGYLLGAQDDSGGFGAAPGLPATVEETALALEALCDCRSAGLADGELDRRIASAAAWLAQATEGGRRFEARPIGLYFARLWYSERLYPLVFTVSALGRALEVLRP